MVQRPITTWKQKSVNVKELGEVYTPDDIVVKMLDLLNDKSIDKTYLEPSCGDGQFLVRILWNKLNNISQPNELDILKTVCSIYGVDIQKDKVNTAKDRMHNLLGGFPVETFDTKGNTVIISRPFDFEITPEFEKVIDYILDINIQVGNTLEENSGLALTEFVFDDRNVTTTEYWLTKHKGLNDFYQEIVYEPLQGIKQEYTTTDYLQLDTRQKKNTTSGDDISADGLEDFDF